MHNRTRTPLNEGAVSSCQDEVRVRESAYSGRSDIDKQPARVIYIPGEGGVAGHKKEGTGARELAAPEETNLLVESEQVMPYYESCIERVSRVGGAMGMVTHGAMNHRRTGIGGGITFQCQSENRGRG